MDATRHAITSNDTPLCPHKPVGWCWLKKGYPISLIPSFMQKNPLCLMVEIPWAKKYQVITISVVQGPKTINCRFPKVSNRICKFPCVNFLVKSKRLMISPWYPHHIPIHMLDNHMYLLAKSPIWTIDEGPCFTACPWTSIILYQLMWYTSCPKIYHKWLGWYLKYTINPAGLWLAAARHGRMMCRASLRRWKTKWPLGRGITSSIWLDLWSQSSSNIQ